MKKQIYSEVVIAAPAAAVWSVLTDVRRYAEWNPFIKRIDGRLEPGQRLAIAIEPVPGKSISFRPLLVRVLDRREIRWIGRAGIAGLFDGEHSLALEPEENDATRFVHQETFSGVLVPFLWWYLKPRLENGFTAMNNALRRRVEQSAGRLRANSLSPK